MGLETDVIVIGGGVAGLAAAAELSRRSVRVLLIEARDRLGGRILTETSSDVEVDVGAEFIHGREPALIQYLREHELADQTAEGTDYYFDGEALVRMDSGDTTSSFDLLSQLSEYLPDQSFATYAETLSVDPEERRWLTGYVEGFNAADARVIGVRGLARQQHAEDAIRGDHSSRLAKGYAALIESLVKDCGAGVQIITGSAVEEIVWRPGQVEVEGRSASGGLFRFSARTVVVTVPLPLLLKLRVTPQIPILAELPTAFRMGPATRLTLQMREPWWEESAPGLGFLFGGAAATQTRLVFPTFWVNRNAPTPLITAWAGGPVALEFEGLDAETLVDVAAQSLARVFARSTEARQSMKGALTAETIRAQVTRAYFHNWQSDPFSGGAYSYVAAGGLAVAERFARPVEQTVWFAGEATAWEGHWGTVHGAFVSGVRAAREISEKLALT